MKIITILLILTLALTACQTSDEIEIGAIFVLTGQMSNWGEKSLKGAELAVEEINENGGINGKNLKMFYEDNEGDNAKKAVDAIHKLNGQGIKIVLGPNLTPAGNAVAPIACENQILMMSTTLGAASFNEECDYIFNLWPHDAKLSRNLAKEAYVQGYRKIAIIGTMQEWDHIQANAMKESFEELGGEVVSFELAQEGELDFRAEVLKAKTSKPEAILFGTDDPHLPSKRLREIGVEVPFFTIILDSYTVEAAEGGLEDAFDMTSLTPSEEFSEKYQARYNEPTDLGADTTYDAVMLLAKAMRETSSEDPTVLKDYINSLDTYQGESGFLTFDGKGGVTKEPKFMIVEDNKLVEI